jgi:hypothetical protein
MLANETKPVSKNSHTRCRDQGQTEANSAQPMQNVSLDQARYDSSNILSLLKPFNFTKHARRLFNKANEVARSIATFQRQANARWLGPERPQTLPQSDPR